MSTCDLCGAEEHMPYTCRYCGGTFCSAHRLPEHPERPSPDEDSRKLFDLEATAARQFAAMLQGTGFETVDVTDLEAPLGEAIIEWFEIPEDAGVVGQTVGEADIKAETGVAIVAIQRGSTSIANPDADTELHAGDILVGLGTREEHAALEAML